MKKNKKVRLTAKVARTLVDRASSQCSDIKGCIKLIVSFSKMGYNSCFIDNDNLNTLTELQKDLTKRGFEVYLDNGKEKFLSVSWY